MNTIINVPFPSTPTIKIIENSIGTRYVSGRFSYGTNSSLDAFGFLLSVGCTSMFDDDDDGDDDNNNDEIVLLMLDKV